MLHPDQALLDVIKSSHEHLSQMHEQRTAGRQSGKGAFSAARKVIYSPKAPASPGISRALKADPHRPLVPSPQMSPGFSSS
jgi:hypothetical protein